MAQRETASRPSPGAERDPAVTSPALAAAQARAAREWARLGARLRTVTPQAVGRSVLVVGALAGVALLANATWPALLPFVVGGLIAYQLLPLVDALDAYMPRIIAAAIAVLGAVSVLVAVLLIVLPPLARAFVRLAADLPTGPQVDEAIARIQEQLGQLPDGSAAILIPLVVGLVNGIREILSSASGGLDDIIRTAIGALLNAVGALIGLIVLPTWMLAMMTEQRRARNAIDTRISPPLRRDAWALVAIVDRATGAYLRGFVVVAVLVGVATYLGTRIVPELGGPVFAEALPVAVFAGAVQLVPIVGAVLGLLPALLILPISPERAAAYAGVYLVARFIGASIIGSRLQGRRLAVHPAILVPGIVMIGQFGLLWLLLSAPLVAIAHDVVKYVHGRLSEPPNAAGVLPGSPEERSARRVASRGPALAARGVAAAYRKPTAPRPLPRAATSAGAATTTT
jgi:predicted PurR-regulated permease PerM